MASQFDAYLEQNPDAREQPPDQVLEELYQTSGSQEPFSQYAEKALRDPERPMGRAVPKAGKRAPEMPEGGGEEEPSQGFKLGEKSIFEELGKSAGRAVTLAGEARQGKVPMFDPKTGHTNQELIERAAELAGWATLPNAAGKAQQAARTARQATIDRRLGTKPTTPEQSIRNVPPDDPIFGKIKPHPERDPGELTTGFDRLYSRAKDKLHATNRGVKAVTGKWSGSPNQPLLAEENPYILQRLMAGNAGRSERFLYEGAYDANTQKTIGPSLKAIIDPVEHETPAAMRYVLAKRAIEKAGQGKETGIDINFARQVVGEVEGSGTEVGKRIMSFQKNLSQYNQNLMKYLKDTGVLSEESFQSILAANQDYIPFYRLLDPKLTSGAPGRATVNPIKAMKGSELDILDPLESVINNTYAFIHIAEKNRAAQALYRLTQMGERGNQVGALIKNPVKPIELADSELQNFLKQYDIETQNPGSFTIFRPKDFQPAINEVAFMIDGKRHLLQVDHEVGMAWKDMDSFTANRLLDIVGAPARLLRAGVTLDPGFTIRNLIRDQFAPLATMPGVPWLNKGAYVPFYDAIIGMSQIMKHGDHYLEWLSAGGANATRTSIDQQYLKLARERLVGGSQLENLGFAVKHPVEALRTLSNLTENATRVGAYRRARLGGYDHLDAAYISRESTLDFARMGQYGQYLNRITAFQNAQMEGPDRIARAIAGRPGAASTALIAGITLPSVALWTMNKDDPRYQQMPRWMKDIYWPVFTSDWKDVTEQEAKTLSQSLPVRELPSKKWQADHGKPFLIPKPFELGVIFGSVPERLLEKYIEDNPDAGKDIAKSLSRALLPELMPTIITPYVETSSNYSFFFDRPIVSRGLERLIPEERYNEFTSDAAKLIAKGLDKLPPPMDDMEVTPIAVEHWVRSWTGTIGKYALDLSSFALRRAGISGEKVEPDWTVSDVPILRSFTTRYPTTLAQSVGDFYKEYFKQEQKIATVRELQRRPGGHASAQDLQDEDKFTKVNKYFNAMRRQQMFVNDIMRNPSMTSTEKRTLIDTEIFRMIAIASVGLDNLRHGEKTQLGPTKTEAGVNESDMRYERFATADNDAQRIILSHRNLSEQMAFTPYARATTKAEMIAWFVDQDAEAQTLLLSDANEQTRKFWLHYAGEGVRTQYGFEGPRLNPPAIRRAPAPRPSRTPGTPPPLPPEGRGAPPPTPDWMKRALEGK